MYAVKGPSKSNALREFLDAIPQLMEEKQADALIEKWYKIASEREDDISDTDDSQTDTSDDAVDRGPQTKDDIDYEELIDVTIEHLDEYNTLTNAFFDWAKDGPAGIDDESAGSLAEDEVQETLDQWTNDYYIYSEVSPEEVKARVPKAWKKLIRAIKTAYKDYLKAQEDED